MLVVLSSGILVSCDKLLTGGDDEGGKAWAVLVGVSQYRVPSFNLRYADDDALDFFDALVRGKNWAPSDITVLLNGSATKGAIAAAISAAGSEMATGDKFVFFFSGHGTFGPDLDPVDEPDGRDEFLVPHDALSNSIANDISDDELELWLSALPTNNIYVVLDSSFSGGFIRRLRADGRLKFIDRGLTVPPAKGLDGMTRDLIRSGYVVQTASAANESPLESNVLRNGVFTFYLTEGLLGPANPDGEFITAQQAFSYAAPRATAFFSGQHAQQSDQHGGPYNLIQQ
jgi:uncharacterized caspase-like protein